MRYVIPLLWKVGYLLSALSIVGFIIVAGIDRWKRKKD